MRDLDDKTKEKHVMRNMCERRAYEVKRMTEEWTEVATEESLLMIRGECEEIISYLDSEE